MKHVQCNGSYVSDILNIVSKKEVIHKEIKQIFLLKDGGL